MHDDFEPNAAGLLVPAKHKLGGTFHAELIRAGQTVDEWDFDNITVNQGLDSTLNVVFNAASQITTWYIGLFQGNYTPVAADTAATIATNSSEFTAYSGGVRPTFVTVTSTAQLITNTASKATFTFTSGGTLYGAFLVSSSTLNGTGGTLMSAARFASSRVVYTADQLLLTYAFSAASS
jgi:hypothetical protein